MEVAVKRVELRNERLESRGARQVRPLDASADFAEYVREHIDGPVLRYSQRVALLKAGQRLGLGRFEANLVIAQVLHREGMAQSYEMRPTAVWVGPLVMFAVLQAALLVGAWWVLG
jgi:hypothetical protein